MIRVLHGFAEQEPMHGLLQENGFIPVHRPFFSHESLSVCLPKVPPELVLISSARTVDYWGEWGHYIQTHGIPVLAIASKTHKKLRQVGIEADMASGSGEGLVALLDTKSCSSFVHLGAERISSTLQKALEDQQRPYLRISVYRSTVLPHLEGFRLLVDVGCVNSERCAELWAQSLMEVPVVCLGQSTQKRALELGLRVLGIAKEPSREMLVAELVHLRTKGAFSMQ